MDSNNDLFSASLEAIDSSKRVAKFQRFINDFQRESEITLNNAQEWIKAELPIVESDINLTSLKEELRSTKIKARRKHLLSALIFEQATRNAIHKYQASTAGLMAIHMLNHIWQAKLEMQPTTAQKANVATAKPKQKSKAEQEHDLKRKKILTDLIKKGEQQNKDSLIQKQTSSTIEKIPVLKKSSHVTVKDDAAIKQKNDLWDKTKHTKDNNNLKSAKKSKPTKKQKKKRNHGVLSRMRNKFPHKLKPKIATKKSNNVDDSQTSLPTNSDLNDSLLDNPNKSSIVVRPGILDSSDKLQFQDHPQLSGNTNDSGVTVRKVLKKREHDTHAPGSNTIIMKLASSSHQKNSTELSIPEQCQLAVNEFCAQYPGYDIVAIRNMAADKIGVSMQYIENLNILPESK